MNTQENKDFIRAFPAFHWSFGGAWRGQLIPGRVSEKHKKVPLALLEYISSSSLDPQTLTLQCTGGILDGDPGGSLMERSGMDAEKHLVNPA